MTKCKKYYECDMATSECYFYDFDKELKNRLNCLKLREKWEEYRKTLSDWKDNK